MQNKLLIVDGSALIHRAYHALPHFTTVSGVATNALFGFIKMLLSVMMSLSPTHVAICFDTPTQTFREKLSPDYQSNRPSLPDDFKMQIPLIQRFVTLVGLPSFLKKGFEADDVIGTISKQALTLLAPVHTYIVTGDRDMFQLVDEHTTVVMPNKGVAGMDYVDEKDVVRRLNVRANQIIDYKGLVGDASDNYPGVRGVGPKKAMTLLAKYDSLKGVYEHLSELDEKTRTLLTQYKADADMSYELATIIRTVPLVVTVETLVFSGYKKSTELETFLDTYNLRSIKKQLSLSSIVPAKTVKVDNKAQNQLSFF